MIASPPPTFSWKLDKFSRCGRDETWTHLTGGGRLSLSVGDQAALVIVDSKGILLVHWGFQFCFQDSLTLLFLSPLAACRCCLLMLPARRDTLVSS